MFNREIFACLIHPSERLMKSFFMQQILDKISRISIQNEILSSNFTIFHQNQQFRLF